MLEVGLGGEYLLKALYCIFTTDRSVLHCLCAGCVCVCQYEHVCICVLWSYIIPKSTSIYRIFRSQCDAAHGNHHENAHLKVAQVHHIMTQPSHAANTQVLIRVAVFIHFHI